MQLQLLDQDNLVPGLGTIADVFDRQREAELIRQIDRCPLTPFHFQGWLGKRLTASFGWSYDFDTGKMAPCASIPGWLLELRARVASQFRLDPQSFEQALVIRYDPGAGIGWHRDRPHFEQVIGVSLGAPAVLRLRRRRTAGGFDRRSIFLEPRGAYLLHGEVRSEWEHSITPMEETRWSVTFRNLSALGRRVLHA